MIKFTLSLVLILCVSTILAQEEDTADYADYERGFYVGNVISDTANFQEERLNYGLPSVRKSDYGIEIRFITYGMSAFNVVVLYYDTQWNVKTYGYHHRSEKEENDWVLKKNDDLDSLFAELVANDIFGLPESSKLSLEKYYFNPKTGELSGEGRQVTCGGYYIVEFKVADQYRKYGFSNPEIYAEYYPSIREFKNYSEIVRIFSGLMKSEKIR